jgi:hypothetical protein
MAIKIAIKYFFDCVVRYHFADCPLLGRTAQQDTGMPNPLFSRGFRGVKLTRTAIKIAIKYFFDCVVRYHFADCPLLGRGGEA